MALLVDPGLGKVTPDADVLPQEYFAVLLQPVKNLFHVLLKILKGSERKSISYSARMAIKIIEVFYFRVSQKGDL